jgi:hypothetical protein
MVWSPACHAGYSGGIVTHHPRQTQGKIMKTVYFENYRNHERFECHNLQDVRVIDGVEYLRVFKLGTQRDFLMRKDQLRKLAKNEANQVELAKKLVK